MRSPGRKTELMLEVTIRSPSFTSPSWGMWVRRSRPSRYRVRSPSTTQLVPDCMAMAYTWLESSMMERTVA